MTKKDFILIAAALAKSQPRTDDAPAHDAWAEAVYQVGCALRSTNPRFKPDTFENACRGN
jgi:hypothetical protein